MRGRVCVWMTVAAVCAAGALDDAAATAAGRSEPAQAPAGQTTPAPPAPRAATAKPQLGGVWKLNEQLSERPGTVPEKGAPIIGPPGGGYGRGGGMGSGRGGGIPGGAGGGRPPMNTDDRERSKETRARLEELMEAPAMLTITEGEGTVTFTEPDGRSRTYKTDGRKEKHQASGATVETQTQWEQGGLVVETDLGSGLKAVHTYSVSTEPRQLIVLLKIDGSRLPRQRPPRRLVYENATPAQP